MMICEKCGAEIKSLNKRRKWCFECRKKLAVERAKAKKDLIRILGL